MFNLNDQRISYWQELKGTIEEKKTLQALENWKQLNLIDRFWAFPGFEVHQKLSEFLKSENWELAGNLCDNVYKKVLEPRNRHFIPYGGYLEQLNSLKHEGTSRDPLKTEKKPCFEVLILHPDPYNYYYTYHNALKALQSERDEFYYDILFVNNLSDAVTALMANENIQAVLSVSGCLRNSDLEFANHWLDSFFSDRSQASDKQLTDSALLLNSAVKALRPEIESYYISETPFAELPSVYFEEFERVFYHIAPFKDLHFYLLSGMRQRQSAPFFNALCSYSRKPKTVFHALPISQGGSLKKTLITKDFYEFYGENIFDAETSSTQRGMDSLLNPKGAIKSAQDKAAKTFGSDQSFFVTNGTSTSNKIIMQANLAPGDIVFVSSDCHKSVPYGVILSGAHVVFLQTNAVEKYDLYGAVPLDQIKERMRELSDRGVLHKLKQVVLTNSTFDGLLYDVETYMMELLALKPDLIFHWDEAWSAHTHFHPIYRRRNATFVARKLQQRLRSIKYKEEYNSRGSKQLPDPERVKIRVYATQSTHKTLSSFRQGSMIHIIDEEFNQDTFLDAYYTHTSTSPNYQILASLDVARRQVAVEGFSIVEKSIQAACWLKEKIRSHEKVSQYFEILETEDIFPLETCQDSSSSETLMINEKVLDFQKTGFRVDPTRVTLDVRKTGLTGNQFRKLLINRYNIQVNKTSRFTVLFIINIGSSEKDVQYLFKTLAEMTDLLSEPKGSKESFSASIPQNRRYHSGFLPLSEQTPHVADLRAAYYAGFDPKNTEYLLISDELIQQAQKGETWVSAMFVTPYPPGFPLLVPGQIVDLDILLYMTKIINDEIHGFQKELGLKVLKDSCLKDLV